jgi:hypothetical protein
MSINSMANSAAARRPDFLPLGVPSGLAAVAGAAGSPPVPMGANPPLPPSQDANAFNTAMNVLFGYIPTEVLTLYVAILAAIGSAKPKPGSVSPAFWITFWVFLALYSWYSTGLAGVAVLVASTVLGLLAPFFQRPLGT